MNFFAMRPLKATLTHFPEFWHFLNWKLRLFLFFFLLWFFFFLLAQKKKLQRYLIPRSLRFWLSLSHIASLCIVGRSA